MNDLVTQVQQFPDALEELSKFVLGGREKLISIRTEKRAIDKVHLAFLLSFVLSSGRSLYLLFRKIWKISQKRNGDTYRTQIIV
ncbi:hypothetical protein [Clostridium sp. E02]|uniref:hypothetical protein n=1 Tax=Clostridium sp. E02 TaxID=2487134 RepID=UPI000F528284|nr:hypothetical protein [Clostridium sp. E02]